MNKFSNVNIFEDEFIRLIDKRNGNVKSENLNKLKDKSIIPKNTRNSSKKYLVLSELILVDLPDGYGSQKINFSDLSVLYFLDSNKKGKFYLEDLQRLSDVIFEKEKEYKSSEFFNQIKAFFTIKMFYDIIGKSALKTNLFFDDFLTEGESIFIEWIINLLNENFNNNIEDLMPEKNINDSNISSKTSNSFLNFIDQESLKIFHKIFNIKDLNDLEFPAFYSQLEEESRRYLSKNKINNLHLDKLKSMNSFISQNQNNLESNFIHIDIIKLFSLSFIRGFIKNLIDLGI